MAMEQRKEMNDEHPFGQKRNEIDFVDLDVLNENFNSNGSVLGLTDKSFNELANDSIGIQVQNICRLSKGKSLAEFSRYGETAKVVKLYTDLLRCYESKCGQNGIRAVAVEKVRAIIEKYKVKAPTLQMPVLNRVTNEYLRELFGRAYIDIEQGQYDSALTKAKTLLEETFCEVLQRNGKTKKKTDDIHTLHSEVKSLYKMRPQKAYDNRINEMLNGVEKILKGISEMRNMASDAHGMGASRFRIEAHHARLFVNAAAMIAEFVLAVAERHDPAGA